LLFQPLLLALASIIGALLTVERRFALIALAYVSHNITILLGIGAAWYWPWIGIYGPTVGLLLAAVLKAAIVWLGLHWLNGTMRWQWDLHHPMLKRALWLAAPTALSVTVNYAGSIVDTSFATRIGVTTVAAIYSAWLLADMPARLIGSAIGQAAFPQLAQAIADGDLIVARRTFVRVAVVAVVLTLPIIVLLLWAGRAGIAFVLERGAFDQAAGDRTFAVLQWYILGLPAFVLTELSSRMLNAMHDTHTPLATNVTQLTAKWAVLNGWGLGWGVVAVPIAHVMTCYGETALLLTMVWRRLRQLRNECKKTPK
jgi:putative peptidoglycan lipid II flippase